MQFDIKKLRLDFIAIGIFIAVAFAYCMPQLQGKKLSAHDNISFVGMAHEAMEYHKATGKEVMWSNSMFGGMPTYTTTVLFENDASPNYIGYMQNILQAVGKPAYFFFIAMVCFYLLMRVLKVDRWVAVIGSFAYAFSTYNPIIISVGHDTKMLTMGYLPAAIAGLYLIYDKKWLTGAAIWCLSVALMAINNHFQVIYYYLFIFLAFGVAMLVNAIRTNGLKDFILASVIAIAAGLVGVGPAMVSILPTNEYAKATMRGGASELSGHDVKTNGGLDKEYAFRWSNGIAETFCIMIPDLFGGSSGEPAAKAPKTSEAIGGRADKLPLYWGPQPFLSGPVYFGAVVCFLFVLGTMLIKSPHKWWIIAASFMGIMLSWGKNFSAVNYFLFDHLPMLNKFRTPSMALVVPQFLFPLLGAWALNDVLQKKYTQVEVFAKLKIAAGVTAGLCLLLGLGASMFFDFSGASDAQMQPELVKLLKEDRASLATTSGLKSAFYILAAAGLIWAFVFDKIKSNIFIGGLALVMVIDLMPIAYQYLNETNYEEAGDYDSIFQPREVDKAIMKDPDPYYRVLDLSKDTYNDAVQAYFHKSVGGYSPAKMEIYQDLIDRHMSRGYNGAVLNMLNTKYIIVGREPGKEQVIPNPKANGNAWFVNEIKWAKTADEEMDALNAPDLGDTTILPNAFDPLKTAIVRENLKSVIGDYAIGKDSAAYVRLAKYGLNDLSFTSKNANDGFAVFSDIYYDKGWKAYVDGKETPIVRTNYVLRGIKIPKGEHKIEFQFRPQSFYLGKNITMASSILIILICLAALFPLFKKPKTA
jgi:hypothetical protein